MILAELLLEHLAQRQPRDLVLDGIIHHECLLCTIKLSHANLPAIGVSDLSNLLIKLLAEPFLDLRDTLASLPVGNNVDF